MKYALESLPELIGEHQFRDLCIALDIDTTVQMPSGDDLASVVRHKVLRHHREIDRRARMPGILDRLDAMSSAATGVTALNEWMKAERGRQAYLAEGLGITTAAIPQWREVPADKLIAVEKITGIRRQLLRPDLFEGMIA